MKTWVKIGLMTLVYAGIWLLFIYFYYGDIKPVGATKGLSLVFGLCMTGVELFFHRNKKDN